MESGSAMSSKDFWRPVGPVSEAFYYMEYEECKRVDFYILVFRGRPDREALKKAYELNLEAFPGIASRLEFKTSGLRERLVRVPAEPHPFEFVEELADKDTGGRLYIDILVDYFMPVLEKGLDLFSEANFRYYFFTFPHDVYVLVYLGSHIGTDGANFMMVARDFLVRYHELVTGAPPEWNRHMVLPSQRPREVDFKWREIISQMRSESRLKEEHPIIRFGNEFKPDKPTRYMKRIVMSPEETRSALDKAKAMGITFNDLLCTEMSKALDVLMDRPEGVQSIWVVVNTRSRTSRKLETSNNTAAVNVDLAPEARKDPETLVREFTAQRKNKLATGRDVANLVMLQGLVRAMQYLPRERRRSLMKKITERPRTMNVSNMGILWPRIADGRITGDTYLESAGDLELLEMRSYFSVSYNQGQAFACSTFRRQFIFALSAFEQTIDKDTADRYLGLVRQGLVG